jgi:hypothetical protein
MEEAAALAAALFWILLDAGKQKRYDKKENLSVMVYLV